jgi:hypothetical protein
VGPGGGNGGPTGLLKGAEGGGIFGVGGGGLGFGPLTGGGLGGGAGLSGGGLRRGSSGGAGGRFARNEGLGDEGESGGGKVEAPIGGGLAKAHPPVIRYSQIASQLSNAVFLHAVMTTTTLAEG